MTPQKPTFVLVHGAWHRPVHGEKLVAALDRHGYKSLALALPSSVEPGAPILEDSQPDIDVIRKAIIDVLDSGSNAIVVMHSYGGIPGMSAVKDLDTASRKKAGFDTSVIALAGISTFLQPAGWTVRDGREDNPPQLIDNSAPATMPIEGLSIPGFYADLPKDEAEKYTSFLRPMSMGALLDECKFTAYEVIPVHYLLCTEDKAFPYEGQKMNVQRIEDAGFRVRTETVVSSHSPFLSMPDRTADFLRRTAGEHIPE